MKETLTFNLQKRHLGSKPGLRTEINCFRMLSQSYFPDKYEKSSYKLYQLTCTVYF